MNGWLPGWIHGRKDEKGGKYIHTHTLSQHLYIHRCTVDVVTCPCPRLIRECTLSNKGTNKGTHEMYEEECNEKENGMEKVQVGYTDDTK